MPINAPPVFISPSPYLQGMDQPVYPPAAFPALFNQVAAMNQTTSHITFYKPSATKSLLMIDDIYFLFDYFVRNFGSSMIIVSRTPSKPDLPINGHVDRRGLENFWTYDAPLMALNNPHILNAMLALAALHYSKAFPNDKRHEFNCMTYYQNAVRGLREDIALQRFTDCLATLTTCLLLAFFETMYGDLIKWYQHMTGARDIIVALDLPSIAAGAKDIYAAGVVPTSRTAAEISALQACDLLATFLHMEIMQSAIGNTQLLLGLEYWAEVPFRTFETTHVYVYDSLLRLAAKTCAWVTADTLRKDKVHPKEGPAPEFTDQDYQNLESARSEWRQLVADLTTFEQTFAGYMAPVPLRGPPSPDMMTPFGPSTRYQSSFAAFLVMFMHMNWLILKRNDPDVPTHGFQTLRYTAKEGVPHVLAIFRALPPTVPHDFGRIGDEALDHGQIVRLLIEITVPAFFAGIQIRDPIQQDWIGGWFEQCYKYTGWDTAKQIIQGIRRGWGYQKAAVAASSASPAVSNSNSSSTAGSSPAQSQASSSSPPGPPFQQEHEAGGSGGPPSNLASPVSTTASARSECTPESDGETLYAKTEMRANRVATARGIL